MSHTYDLLSDPSQTLQHAGLNELNMETVHIEKQNTDGTWPHSIPERETNYVVRERSKTTNEATATHARPLPLKPRAMSVSVKKEPKHKDEWVLEQLQSQHDELVQSVATEQKRANQASERAQNTLRRLAQRESEFQSQTKAFEERLQVLERSLTAEQEQRMETEKRASQAEESVSQLQCQLQDLTESLQVSEREKETATQKASRAEEAVKQRDIQLQELTESLQMVEEERNGARQRYEAAESRIRSLENQLQDVQQQQRNTSQQLTETEQRLQQAYERADQQEQRAATAENRLQQAYERANQQEQRAATAETRLQHSDQVFQDMFQRLIGQLPQSQPHWVVPRNEIQLLQEELGSGGWATVRVGTFRGNRVAAKCLHRQIVSAHNVRLFTREMNMAANARHPNLLQFIGATLDNEEPIILTELMPTSLRRVMEEGTRLTHLQIISIARQVALALNYLHLTQPEAIIHRDVSSSNVLLESLQSSWKAKLSDYGSANFVRHTTTAGPGNPTYAAPEASNPTQQSAKMDVFSFGVLLVEMCSGELAPAEHRDRLLADIQWPAMVELIQQCLKHEPQRRPDMNTVITQLDQI
jgi:chemotaxis protein histidine kinase CheA